MKLSDILKKVFTGDEEEEGAVQGAAEEKVTPGNFFLFYFCFLLFPVWV